MKAKTNRPEWMNDKLVKNIDVKKLEFLEAMFSQVQGKSQKDLMTLVVPLMKKIKEENLSLTTQEMNAAINAIKKHSTEEEINKIDQILKKSADHKT
jgi:hypothetical protein